MIRTAMTFAALALAACASSPDVSSVDPGSLPPEVRAAVHAAAPGLSIAEAELKLREGRRYYDVGGRLANGEEIELDLLQTPGGWRVVEIQRDIAWADAPTAVRTAASARWRGPDPARVIESRQAEGDEVIYELFAPGRPQTPALEVMLKDGAATVLAETWPH